MPLRGYDCVFVWCCGGSFRIPCFFSGHTLNNGNWVGAAVFGDGAHCTWTINVTPNVEAQARMFAGVVCQNTKPVKVEHCELPWRRSRLNRYNQHVEDSSCTKLHSSQKLKNIQFSTHKAFVRQHVGALVCVAASQQACGFDSWPGNVCLFSLLSAWDECELWFVPLWPCDELVTSPGCHLALALWQLGEAPGDTGNLEFRWMDRWIKHQKPPFL